MSNIIPPIDPDEARRRAAEVRQRRDDDTELHAAILRVADWLDVSVEQLHEYKDGQPFDREELRQISRWTDVLTLNMGALCRHLGVKTHLDVEIQRHGPDISGERRRERRELRRLLDRYAPGFLDRAQTLADQNVDADFIKHNFREYAFDARDTLARLLAVVGR